ncbi:MAG TPA: ATP-binding protein [Vicinamibacterales bacterium]|nr:ATP-binding protein [Vicinamibacterales bacterium]
MAMTSVSIAVNAPPDAAAARRAAEDAARRSHFDVTRTGQVAIVVTELATNILKHAQHGEILVTPCRNDAHRGLEVLAIDRAPGIADLGAALVDGRSTAGTLGQGLGAIRRLANDFDIFTQPGKGTVALARVWARHDAAIGAQALTIGAVNVAKPGEEACGDAWSARIGPHYATLMVADGLGHGLLAAEASAAAIGTFERDPLRSPSLTLDDVHLALRSTRGAAVAIAAIEFGRDIVAYAGLGNIAASLVVDQSRRSLVSHNGTAGHVARKLQEFSYPMPPAASLVIHSDGLGSHWNPADYSGLWSRDPAVAAGVLYRDFTRRRDDVTVVVGRRSI